ncbi:MAG: hypothetical protein LBM59_02475 [Ruminococcus sp.]|jgi:hypothetical protein|nr:hypothetical protein [Ruminococcus sp.]
MKNISFRKRDCDELIKIFDEEQLENLFNDLYNQMLDYVKDSSLDDYAEVNELILQYAVIDYFYDIKRLKDFHNDIAEPNSEKIIAYTCYWLRYRKPIQIKNDGIFNLPMDKQELLREVNELFILKYILNYLSTRVRKCHILLRDGKDLKNFSKYLRYYLKYRLRDAQSLEMIITAFLAGQIYEQLDEDLNGKLHYYDNDNE